MIHVADSMLLEFSNIVKAELSKPTDHYRIIISIIMM